MKKEKEFSVSPLRFSTASFKGKDLLEATGQNPKASLEFKDLMTKLSSIYSNKSYHVEDFGQLFIQGIEPEIKRFASFIYNDEKRAKYFTDIIIDVLSEGE